MKLDCEFPCEQLSLIPSQKHFKSKSEPAALKLSELCCSFMRNIFLHLFLPALCLWLVSWPAMTKAGRLLS